ncbi:hypothetical protein V8C86DRAFT_2978802 [Haematococcus lacustris]
MQRHLGLERTPDTAAQPFTRFSLPPVTAPSPTELAACPWPLGLLDLSGNRLLDDSADLMAAIMQQLVEVRQLAASTALAAVQAAHQAHLATQPQALAASRQPPSSPGGPFSRLSSRLLSKAQPPPAAPLTPGPAGHSSAAQAAGGSVVEAAVRACQRLAALLGRPPLQLHLADNHYPFSLPQLRALSSTLAAAAAPPYVAGFLACTSPSGTLPGVRPGCGGFMLSAPLTDRVDRGPHALRPGGCPLPLTLVTEESAGASSHGGATGTPPRDTCPAATEAGPLPPASPLPWACPLSPGPLLGPYAECGAASLDAAHQAALFVDLVIRLVAQPGVQLHLARPPAPPAARLQPCASSPLTFPSQGAAGRSGAAQLANTGVALPQPQPCLLLSSGACFQNRSGRSRRLSDPTMGLASWPQAGAGAAALGTGEQGAEQHWTKALQLAVRAVVVGGQEPGAGGSPCAPHQPRSRGGRSRHASYVSLGSEADLACAICFENPTHLVIKGCGHKLCASCYRQLVRPTGEGAAAACPFCRGTILGFEYCHL